MPVFTHTDMFEIDRKKYKLLLDFNPCEIFWHLGIAELHGLNYKDCILHGNTQKDSYITGWCNFFPKDDNRYTHQDDFFVFINLTRCMESELEMILTINHELFHAGLIIFNWDIQHEEEIITWAEAETRAIYPIIKSHIEQHGKN